MGRILIIVALLAAFAVPAALADKPPSGQNAAQQCRAQLQRMGTKDFRALWGNLGQCVSLTAQQNQENVQSAEKQCRAERAHDRAAFAQKYGHGLGKCVSQLAKAKSHAEQKATLNAAQQCKAERSKDRAAFRTTYGKHPFAACVADKKGH
jgi:soluble cytochrome b562